MENVRSSLRRWWLQNFCHEGYWFSTQNLSCDLCSVPLLHIHAVMVKYNHIHVYIHHAYSDIVLILFVFCFFLLTGFPVIRVAPIPLKLQWTSSCSRYLLPEKAQQLNWLNSEEFFKTTVVASLSLWLRISLQHIRRGFYVGDEGINVAVHAVFAALLWHSPDLHPWLQQLGIKFLFGIACSVLSIEHFCLVCPAEGQSRPSNVPPGVLQAFNLAESIRVNLVGWLIWFQSCYVANCLIGNAGCTTSENDPEAQWSDRLRPTSQ